MLLLTFGDWADTLDLRAVDCRLWYGLLDETRLRRLMEIDAARERGEGGSHDIDCPD